MRRGDPGPRPAAQGAAERHRARPGPRPQQEGLTSFEAVQIGTTTGSESGSLRSRYSQRHDRAPERRALRGRTAAHRDAAPAGQRVAPAHPRNNDALLFDGLPWVDRAQQEHDAFAEALRDRGVEVLYLSRLLAETLADPGRPGSSDDLTIGDLRLGDTLRRYLSASRRSGPAELAEILMAGLAHDEVARHGSLVDRTARAATTSSSTRCPTCCSPGTPASGWATGWRSPRWRCRPGAARPS